MKNIFVKNRNWLTLTVALGIVILAAMGAAWMLRPGCQQDGGVRPLRVGMMSGWPPYMSINERGEFVGFDVDVAQLIGKKLGRPVEIIDGGSLSSLFLSLESDKIDLIFSGLDITEERRARMNMVPYVGEDITFVCAVFNGKPPAGVKTFGDLAQLPGGAVVCVEANASNAELLAFYPQITKKELRSMADMVIDVQTGKSIALIAEPRVTRRLLEKVPGLVSIDVELPEKLKMYGCGIAIKKSATQLTEQVGCLIRQLRAGGELEKLEKQWNMKE